VANGKYLSVKKVLLYQVLLILLVTVSYLLVRGFNEAGSALIGGCAAFIPNLYFAFKTRVTIGRPAKKILNNFYAAESGKLILTGALFLIIFQIPELEILPLIISYMVALSVFWFALLMR